MKGSSVIKEKKEDIMSSYYIVSSVVNSYLETVEDEYLEDETGCSDRKEIIEALENLRGGINKGF